MNSGLNFVLHCGLRSETQCHTPPSRSCLGLQVASCLPVFLSSGTAGAINQLPPELAPSARVWPAPQQHKPVSSGLLLLQGTPLSSFQHPRCCRKYSLLFLFPGFQGNLHWHFRAVKPFFVKSPQFIGCFNISLLVCIHLGALLWCLWCP